MKVTKLPKKSNADYKFRDIAVGTVFQKYKKPTCPYPNQPPLVLNHKTYYMKMRKPNEGSAIYDERSNTVSLDQASKSVTGDNEIVRIYVKEELIIREIEE